MYKSLEINNYRGIKQAKIDDFSHINLFFGKNNCGKSSVLESLFLISGQSNPNLTFRANSLRGLGQYSRMSTLVDFYGASKDNEINIVANGDEPRTLHISAIESDSHEVSLSLQDGINKYYGLRAEFTRGNEKYNSRITVSNDNPQTGRLQVDKRYQESLKCRILGSSFVQASDLNSSFTDIVTRKDEEQVLDILRIVEPNLRDIQLAGDYFMVDVGLDSRLPVNVLGDGFRKALNIILAMHDCADGVLLVDELDNGLHYSVMPKLWEAIFEASKRDSVQVFVTTHSIDLLWGLKKCVDNNLVYGDYLSAYKINKSHDDELSALRYDYRSLAYGLTQEIEMR